MAKQMKFTTIEEYHAAFPEGVQEKLEILRKFIRQLIPGAQEVISYNIPAFKLKKIIIFYAAYKKHISLYPAPGGKDWEKDFEPYITSGRGTIQFPIDQALPLHLIEKIVKFRLAEALKSK